MQLWMQSQRCILGMACVRNEYEASRAGIGAGHARHESTRTLAVNKHYRAAEAAVARELEFVGCISKAHGHWARGRGEMRGGQESKDSHVARRT